MTNTNCLANIRCPECLSEDEFYIEASVLAVVSDDGAEAANGDFYWEEQSTIRCSQCAHSGTVAEFTFKSNPQ
ncbi:MAG TPA: hypothetical protein VMF91_07495 [Bryobacteraceae bacterium]|nr:hypothetical protein [Bryobacteraceae bacterium]